MKKKPNLTNNAQRLQNSQSAFGSVVDLTKGFTPMSPLGAFTVTLDNSGGSAAANYIIGDYSKLIRTLKGGTIVEPDSCTVGATSTAVSAMNFSFAGSPIVVGSVNYKVTSSANQFNNNLQEIMADIDGTLNISQIVTAAAERNTAFNSKLLTLKTNIILSNFRALYLVVNAGETVELTLTPTWTANRESLS